MTEPKYSYKRNGVKVDFVPDYGFNARGVYNFRTITAYHVLVNGELHSFLQSTKEDEGWEGKKVTLWEWDRDRAPNVFWARAGSSFTRGPRPMALPGNLKTAREYIVAQVTKRGQACVCPPKGRRTKGRK